MSKAEFQIIDYTTIYEPIMKFNRNKSQFIHRWYPFVEGYSKEFITNIINEIQYKSMCCLEPFTGSGTTPVELQQLGIKCISFEVSPFMYKLARVKLRRDYTHAGFIKAKKIVVNYLNEFKVNVEDFINTPGLKTIVNTKKLTKWLFHKASFKAVLDIKYAISKIEDLKYKELFEIALASILLEVSNVYRNGKCLSYKKNWNSKWKQRKTIHKLYLSKLETIFEEDIKLLNEESNDNSFTNYDFAYYGDVREKLKLVKNKSIDLVITSPPYLNSRDYTDIYMIELWVLDLISDYPSLLELRKRTLRSHVQVKHGKIPKLRIKKLTKALKALNKYKKKFWNNELPNMILGYFRLDAPFYGLHYFIHSENIRHDPKYA